ncbi:hypothetical protein ACQR3P_28515 [Rhodococcus sp. IEGM1300]
MNQLDNLSGQRTTYSDGNLYSSQAIRQATTKSILLIGSAVDGPVGEPVSVNAIGGPKEAERLFGGVMEKKRMQTGKFDPVTGDPIYRFVDVPHQGNLVRTMYEALAQGNDDIRLVRIDGRKAKTEITARDSARMRDEVLGKMPGNQSVDMVLPTTDGVVAERGITRLTVKDAQGAVVRTVSGATLWTYLSDVRLEEGQYITTLAADKVSVGQTLEVEFVERKRTYTEVQYVLADLSGENPDRLLTRDAANPRYFASTKQNWSNRVDLGHTISVKVNGQAIPWVDAAGNFLYRPGLQDGTVTNENKQIPTDFEYAQGGVRFTPAYDVLVASEGYPALNSSSVVEAEYFWFEETTTNGLATGVAVGNAPLFPLRSTPENQVFRVFYESAGVRYYVEDADVTLELPVTSGDIARVRLTNDAAPINVTLVAVYETAAGGTGDPVLEIAALHPGSAYAGLHDLNDEASLYGVQVMVEHDATDDLERVITFIKPESKRLSKRDVQLVYKTKDLQGIQTIRQFANLVNGDRLNNIVRLEVSTEHGATPVRNLFETGRPIFLGEQKDELSGEFGLKKDMEATAGTLARYPWIGDSGVFNKTDIESMTELYGVLGGVYEIDETGEYTAVKQGLYSKLEQYNVDQIVLLEGAVNSPVGKFVFEGMSERLEYAPERKFATQLAQHCAIVTAKSYETIGFIETLPVLEASLSGIQANIDALTADEFTTHYMFDEANDDLILDENDELIDIGMYVNKVFGPEVGLAQNRIGNYVAGGAVTYAGLVSTLAEKSAPTNKRIAVNGLRYTLTDPQHNLLLAAGYVAFDRKTSRAGEAYYVVKEGVTSALPNSDYKRLSTLRISHREAQVVRYIVEPFIGEPNGLAQRNAMATAIQAGLDQEKELGYVNDFKFDIYASQRDQVLGNGYIDLDIVPAFEMRRINKRVALRAAL